MCQKFKWILPETYPLYSVKDQWRIKSGFLRNYGSTNGNKDAIDILLDRGEKDSKNASFYVDRKIIVKDQGNNEPDMHIDETITFLKNNNLEVKEVDGGKQYEVSFSKKYKDKKDGKKKPQTLLKDKTLKVFHEFGKKKGYRYDQHRWPKSVTQDKKCER